MKSHNNLRDKLHSFRMESNNFWAGLVMEHSNKWHNFRAGCHLILDYSSRHHLFQPMRAGQVIGLSNVYLELCHLL